MRGARSATSHPAHASTWASSNPSDYLIDLVHALKRQYRAGAVPDERCHARLDPQAEGRPGQLPVGHDEGIVHGRRRGTLLGYSVVTDDFMPDIGANAYPIAFGDFKQAYYVIERKGIAILRDPAGGFPHVRSSSPAAASVAVSRSSRRSSCSRSPRPDRRWRASSSTATTRRERLATRVRSDTSR
jgi:HK97 family phage major capsid protein